MKNRKILLADPNPNWYPSKRQQLGAGGGRGKGTIVVGLLYRGTGRKLEKKLRREKTARPRADSGKKCTALRAGKTTKPIAIKSLKVRIILIQVTSEYRDTFNTFDTGEVGYLARVVPDKGKGFFCN